MEESLYVRGPEKRFFAITEWRPFVALPLKMTSRETDNIMQVTSVEYHYLCEKTSARCLELVLGKSGWGKKSRLKKGSICNSEVGLQQGNRDL